MSGAESLRFAGKIFGSSQDYWIAIGRLSTAEEDSKDASAEISDSRRGILVSNSQLIATGLVKRFDVRNT